MVFFSLLPYTTIFDAIGVAGLSMRTSESAGPFRTDGGPVGKSPYAPANLAGTSHKKC